MEYDAIETDLSAMEPEQRRRFRITGTAAMDQLLSRRNIADQDGVAAYVDQAPAEEPIEDRWGLPEGDQEVYVLFQDETPSAFPFGKYKIVDIDTVVEDYHKGNPRKFAYELEGGSYMSEFLGGHLSTAKREEIENEFGTVL